MNIVEKIFDSADPGSIALIDDHSTLTYQQLSDLAEAVAERIRTSGVMNVAGVPRIGLSCPNGLSYVVFALGIVRAGACLVPVAGELSPLERDRLVASTGLHAVVIAPGGEWNHALPGHSAEIDAQCFRAIILSGLRDFNPETLSFDEDKLSSLNPAFIRFSSGTTGSSKGVVLSHQSLGDRIRVANCGLQIDRADRVVWVLPMAHHFAVSIMLYLMNGAATVIVNSHFAGDILAAARLHSGTVVYGSPFHYAMLAADASGLAWPGLRLAVSTTAALPLATALAFDARFGVPLSQCLGIIEAGLPLLNTDAPRRRPESVGRAIPGFSIALRDEQGGGVPAGQPGELFIRGPGMLDAYLSPWQPQSGILEDGWFRTGDLAMMDDEGFVTLAGRSKTVINVAGMKCFPEEIEAVLCSCHGIVAARVTAKAHPKFGSVPVASLVPDNSGNPPSIESLLAHCKKALAQFKIPVEFQYVQSLPLTPSGKIRR